MEIKRKRFMIGKNPVQNFYRASAKDFKKIPGSPVAYWASGKVIKCFSENILLKKIGFPKQGMTTSDNERFLRQWFEVSIDSIGFNKANLFEAKESLVKWFPYNKGGDYRKWYGNQSFILNYWNDGYEIKKFHEELNKTNQGGRLKNQSLYFKESISWSFISSAYFGVRYYQKGFIFDVAGSSLFPNKENFYRVLGLLCSKIGPYLLKVLNPTLNFQAQNISALPYKIPGKLVIDKIEQQLILYAKNDWNSYETSWDFTKLPLLEKDFKTENIFTSYQNLRVHWQAMTSEMKRLEEENNRIFIEAYGLEDGKRFTNPVWLGKEK
ncbi:MAG: hypothetical protein U5P10_14780 [Spirochaetia bacterium]|nr:hypothetical protein [Spirochaetia bacterium]